MTSNIGSQYLIDGIQEDGTVSEAVKGKVENEMTRYFRPEFLNRIDDTVVFSPLTENQIIEIIALSIGDIEHRLADRNMKLVLGDDAKSYIAKEAYTPAYGARPVKRYLQKHVETQLAGEIIRGNVKDGDTIVIGAADGKLTFTVK
jgi:ATP-dependent Clp protease ATP-binding subunit ClpB